MVTKDELHALAEALVYGHAKIDEEIEVMVAKIDEVITKLEEPAPPPPVEPPDPVDPTDPPDPVDPVDPVDPTEPVDPPVPDPGPPVDPIEGTGEKIRVANGDALTKILARKDIKPGTTLALHPDGSFPGTYTCYNSGTDKEAGAIRIVGEKHDAKVGPRPTKITGRFIARGSYIKLSGFDFTGSGRKVEIWGKGNRVNRCTFKRIRHDGIVYLMGNSTPETEIDRCVFEDFAGAAIRGELQDVRKNQNMKFHRSHFKNHSTLGDNESVILILTDSFNMGNVQYHLNLFENCLKNNGTGQKEIISVKTGGAGITENTVIGTDGFLCLRESNGSRVVGNWMDGSAYIKVFGDNHVIVNNRGEKVVAELNRGDAYSTKVVPDRCRSFGKAGRSTVIWDGRCKGAHCGTRWAKVENNIGLIVIGHKDQARYGFTQTCLGLKLRNNASKAERIGSYPDMVEMEIGVTTNTAKRLTPADVGLKA